MCFWFDNFTQSKFFLKQLHYIIEAKSSFMIFVWEKRKTLERVNVDRFVSQQTQIIASFAYELLTNKLRMTK